MGQRLSTRKQVREAAVAAAASGLRVADGSQRERRTDGGAHRASAGPTLQGILVRYVVSEQSYRTDMIRVRNRGTVQVGIIQ